MSIKNKVRVFITQNKYIGKLYEVYHENAKYYYNRNNPKVILDPKVSLKSHDLDGQTFFGYYDKSAICNNHVIFQRVNSSNLDLNKTIDIIVDGKKVSETNTWNWQQGSMLGFLDNNRIIHNFYDNGYKAKMINLETKEETVLSLPVYSVSKDGKFALTLNFKRLALLRPDYGYFNEEYKNLPKLDENDGIFYIDLNTKETSLLISLNEIAAFKPLTTMENAYHKVNHIDISPNNDKFIFLHRWYDANMKKYTRLLSYDLKLKQLYVLSSDDMVSHCTWKNNDEIVGFMRKFNHGDKYYLIKDKTAEFSIIGDGILTEDGHPTITLDEQYMITDTYPDHTCRSKLLLFNLKTNKLITIGEFYSPRRYKGVTRCDLHPRLDKQNNILTFDSVHTGLRKMYEIDLKPLLNEGDL